MSNKKKTKKYPLIKTKYIIILVFLTFIIALFYTKNFEKTLGVTIFSLIFGLPSLRSPHSVEEKD